MVKGPDRKSGVVLAMFGTTVEKGLSGLLNIRDRMISRFQHTPVKIAFTSRIIRGIWQERVNDPAYLSNHPELPADILNIRSPADEIKHLINEGVNSLVVQPVHIAPAHEKEDINTYMLEVKTQEREKLFSEVQSTAVGRPALGTLEGKYPYKKDIETFARSLSQDFFKARQKKAAVWYMGHGNKLPETGNVYGELMEAISSQYPDIPVVMSMIEGSSPVPELIEDLKRQNAKRIVLKALMVVAGNHAQKDMVGEDQNALKPMLEKQGFQVFPDLTGLGEITAFADIFIQHTEDAARDAEIILQ